MNRILSHDWKRGTIAAFWTVAVTALVALLLLTRKDFRSSGDPAGSVVKSRPAASSPPARDPIDYMHESRPEAPPITAQQPD